jgi:altronate hydrolase
MNPKVLQLNPLDNVLVALQNLVQGDSVTFSGQSYSLASNVAAKHKFAIRDLSAGDPILMYGVVVGKAVEPIAKGDALTTRNVRHDAAAFHEKSDDYRWSPPEISRWTTRTFRGYRRSDGQVGTRNYWLVVPLVFCENRNIGVLKQAFEEELGFAAPQIYRRQVAELARLYKEGKFAEINSAAISASTSTPPRSKIFENVDGIKFLIHEGGCGGTREDSNNLCGLIAGYIHHPNVAGATILSLGCQHAQIPILREEIRKRNPNFDKPLVIFEQQQTGSEETMLTEAIRKTFFGLMQANDARRTDAPLSHLCVGLKCGGSDGFSGLSANPAIGHTADLLAALGGRTILSEFPELCGVEQELINRCTSKEIGDRFIHLMRSYNSRAKPLAPASK